MNSGGMRMLELAAVLLLGAVAVSYLIVTETDLLKAVAYSGVFGGLILMTLYILMAPDVILAYVAISVGLSTGLMIFVISKTTRHEVV